MFGRRPSQPPEIQTGDIIAFSGRGWPSILINLFTYGVPFWHISHVGIIRRHQGELLLFESTTLSDLPCVIQGRPFRGTQAVRLNDRLKEYSGRAWHYPLYRQMFEAESERLNGFLADHIGIPYDYIGAVRSGGIGWSWLESLLHQEDLSYIFCSELCAAAHRQIGMLRTDNVSRWNPNRFIRHERRERILRKPWGLQ